MNTTKIREYYGNAKLELPRNMQWRILKIKLQNGGWRTFTGVRTVKELRNILCKHTPSDVYVSLNSYINPSEHKKGREFNILLDSELWIEFDAEDCGGLKKSHRQSIECKKYIGANCPELKLEEWFCSGGGHYLCYSMNWSLPEEVALRKQKVTGYKKLLFSELEQMGFQCDYEPMLDYHRIRRLNHTLNGKREYVLSYSCDAKERSTPVDVLADETTGCLQPPLQPKIENTLQHPLSCVGDGAVRSEQFSIQQYITSWCGKNKQRFILAVDNYKRLIKKLRFRTSIYHYEGRYYIVSHNMMPVQQVKSLMRRLKKRWFFRYGCSRMPKNATLISGCAIDFKEHFKYIGLLTAKQELHKEVNDDYAEKNNYCESELSIRGN